MEGRGREMGKKRKKGEWKGKEGRGMVASRFFLGGTPLRKGGGGGVEGKGEEISSHGHFQKSTPMLETRYQQPMPPSPSAFF